MLFHFTHQVSDICSLETATYELEQVFRAVLYIDQRDGEFQPIGTKHFCVFPRKKYWKIAKKLKFSQNGECLTGNPFYFEFIVKPWKQNQEVEAVRNSETNMNKNENLVEIRENSDSTHEVTDPSYCDEVNGEVTHERSTKKTDCAIKLKQARVVLEPCDVDISKYTPKRKSIQFVPVENSVDEMRI
ncbi:hypothetical protein FSP39_012230 [Pinctada imbricata]|uniref:Uncharacterized protein n=1 Tax=Pinctada imbricata TaxID=66713 RepID=A0AA88YQT8_PINIB|nr:hypothetical protein FSP39_012230 [Pinctada imbricata]